MGSKSSKTRACSLILTNAIPWNTAQSLCRQNKGVCAHHCYFYFGKTVDDQYFGHVAHKLDDGTFLPVAEGERFDVVCVVPPAGKPYLRFSDPNSDLSLKFRPTLGGLACTIMVGRVLPVKIHAHVHIANQ